MEENVKKAFDFANELTKQLLTLATAVLTFSVAFVKDLLPASHKGSLSWELQTSWLLLFLSIFFGVLTMQALTGHLDPLKPRRKIETEGLNPLAMPRVGDVEDAVVTILTIRPLTIQTGTIRALSFLQWVCFVAGMGTFGLYGWYAVTVLASVGLRGMGAGGI